MRGYEVVLGLWWLGLVARYESPCGVMSGHTRKRCVIVWQLRIPMRGYESAYSGSERMEVAGYESPCGVMRIEGQYKCNNKSSLRIPMRGYEIGCFQRFYHQRLVTNPHAGL